MAEHLSLGQWGEAEAARFLENKGYSIVARNWRTRRAELDIVAFWAGTLVFVEVKTRSDAAFGPPELAVTPRKQRLMADAAQAFCFAQGHDGPLRFDILSVLRRPEGAHIEHFEDVFFPNY